MRTMARPVSHLGLSVSTSLPCITQDSCSARPVLMRLLQAHNSAATSLALTTDGWRLLSGGRDGIIVLWDLRSHAQLSVTPVYEAVEGAALCAPALLPFGFSACLSAAEPAHARAMPARVPSACCC